MKPPPRFFLLLSLALLTHASLLPAFAREEARDQTDSARLYHEYDADRASLRMAYELPASESWLDRKQALDHKWLSRLDKFDYDSLDAGQRAEYLLLRSEIHGDLDDTALARKRLAEIAPLVPFRRSTSWNLPGGIGIADSQAAASKMAALAAAVKEVHEHLPKPGGKPVSAAVALHAPPRCKLCTKS